MNHSAGISLFLTIATIWIAGCSSYTPAPEPGTQEYRDSMVVIAQVCIPTPYTPKYLSGWQVDRYGPHGERRSAGSLIQAKRLSSANKQTIFEIFTHNRQIDLVALVIRADEVE